MTDVKKMTPEMENETLHDQIRASAALIEELQGAMAQKRTEI